MRVGDLLHVTADIIVSQASWGRIQPGGQSGDALLRHTTGPAKGVGMESPCLTRQSNSSDITNLVCVPYDPLGPQWN